jgi:hypothetical protein
MKEGVSNSLSWRVIVPSKSVKKMNLGLVFMAGRSDIDPIFFDFCGDCSGGR